MTVCHTDLGWRSQARLGDPRKDIEVLIVTKRSQYRNKIENSMISAEYKPGGAGWPAVIIIDG